MFGVGTRTRARERELGQARFAARFEQIDVPQSFCDVDGVLVEVNPSFCRLLGRSREELCGTPISALVHRSDDGSTGPVVRRLLEGEVASAQFERVLCHADGRPVPVLVDAALLRLEDGVPFGSAAVLRDLSALHGLERRSQQLEDFHLALAQRASDLAAVTDAAGRLTYASAALGEVTGYALEDVLGTPLVDLVHPEDRERSRTAYEEVAASASTTTVTLRVRVASHRHRWFEVVMTNLLDTAVGGVVLNLHDVTDRLEAAEALRTSEARYRAIAECAQEGILAVSVDGRTLYANAKVADILGVDPAEVYRRSAVSLLDPDGTNFARERFAARIERGRERYQVRYHHPDGGERLLGLAASALEDGSGRHLGSLAMITDLTAERRMEEQLRHAVLHDQLTGLPNRALLMDRLEHALVVAPDATCVLFVDLDHFRVLNDSRGHVVGDRLLRAVAERLASRLRRNEMLARFGGDEFAVVCEGTDENRGQVLARDLLTALTEPFDVSGRSRHISASIGVALSPARSAEELLRNAETAMHSAKVQGRRRVRLFDWDLAADADERYALSGDLRTAIADDALSLHYQPVVSLTTGRVVGMEALARWWHDRLGAVSPDRFVKVAESTGVAGDLDHWVVRRALREAGRLRRAGTCHPDSYVAVNLSATNLTDPALEDVIRRAADQAGLSPTHVVLEITETAIMDNTEVAITLLGRLRAAGFRLAVDDFGTGHSSMAYLRTLPVSILKIDRCFVQGIDRDAGALAIVTSIVELARALDLDVVAEGVETEQHARLLRSLGCSAAQGWLWSPAVPPSAAASAGTMLRTFDVAAAVAGRGAVPDPRPGSPRETRT